MRLCRKKNKKTGTPKNWIFTRNLQKSHQETGKQNWESEYKDEGNRITRMISRCGKALKRRSFEHRNLHKFHQNRSKNRESECISPEFPIAGRQERILPNEQRTWILKFHQQIWMHQIANKLTESEKIKPLEPRAAGLNQEQDVRTDLPQKKKNREWLSFKKK